MVIDNTLYLLQLKKAQASYIADISDLNISTKVIQSGYNGTPLGSADQIQYSITITNSGTEDATEITVSDIVPQYTTLVSGSADTVQIASLPAGTSTTLVHHCFLSMHLFHPRLIRFSSSVKATVGTDVIVADNDTSGHCGVADDKLDDALDSRY